MMWSLVISLFLLAANAFFVASEFALMAAKRHRLEEAAETSRAARAALAGVRELSLMLAGAQLGITLCTLGLGALAKPAVADLVDPLFLAVGLPSGLSYAISFAISLVHIREAVRHRHERGHPGRDLMTVPLTLSAALPVAAAVTRMRAERAQLALVADADDRVVGIAALEDLLEELIGDFEDETDQPN